MDYKVLSDPLIGGTAHDTQGEARSQLFEARPIEDRRSEASLLAFYAWLEKYHPELLSKEKWGDPYEHLKSELKGLYS
jgi:hypothetical protein